MMEMTVLEFMTFCNYDIQYHQIVVMIVNALRRCSRLSKGSRASFADDKKKSIESEAAANQMTDEARELKRRFSGQVKIEEKFHQKTSALYDRYMQVREKPLICHDGLHLAYEFLIERLPIFVPYHQKTFETERNRYVYGKKTGFYLQLPKDLKLENGDNPFKDYDQANEENKISHQIVLSQTEKINYRQNSKLWRHTDPTIIDPHSIQTYSSNNVYMLVKQKGKWIFPTKVLNQKDTHNNVFNLIATQLFQGTKYPIVHFANKKPMGIRKVMMDGYDKEVRVMTFRGVTAFGIPKFPTEVYDDFAWTPKPLFSNYFSDEYFEQTAWAATHTF